MTKNEAAAFWQKSAAEDLKVAQDNLNLKHYHWSLFFYQLVLEKTLKSLIVEKKGEAPLPTHNLARLAEEAGLKLTLNQEQDFKEITTFNIEARYDDLKLSFYKKANKEYTKKWAKRCEEYYLWLKKR